MQAGRLGQSAPVSKLTVYLDWPNSSFIRVQLQSEKGRQKLETGYQKNSRIAPESRLEKQTGLEESCLRLKIVELKLL